MKILILSSHTEDAELAAGATIKKFARQGHEIFHYCFSSCSKSELIDEFAESSLKLSIGATQLGDFQERAFESDRQKVLQILIDLSDLKPDLVITHGTNDIHQDHFTVCRESIRAFKHCKILGYNHPWNSLAESNNYFSVVEQCDIYAKIEALKCYKSQQERSYFKDGYQLSRAIISGQKVNALYAEEFEIIRWIE